METLKDTLLQLASFSDWEVEDIISHFKPVTLKKKESLLTNGQVCRQIAYIEKGSLIYLQISPEGDPIAIDFAFEGEFVAYLQSFLTETPADIDIIANEPTQLLVISKEHLYHLYEKYSKMERIGRLLLEEGLMKMAKGRTIFQTMDNRERYLYVMKHSSKILERIPQYHIATYLGIKPESLSRIRRSLTQ
ncbi:Crp/Fnr family transcriptional regulator [Ulvibacterium sp.]|uniref:Crp/Fnr family transcriptional regulator n=1 Tax=Ulvibacterium sp. TaxID=2665914 RepID=UPI003BA9E6B7